MFLTISLTVNAQQTSQDESCGITEYTNAAKLLDPLLESKMLNYEQHTNIINLLDIEMKEIINNNKKLSDLHKQTAIKQCEDYLTTFK